MISSFNSPAVCLIDDEAEDYGPFRAALDRLHIASVHFDGRLDSLPDAPFSSIRVVFQDLHLNASNGKNAASYTANLFTKLIDKETAPVVVVIWSKYADDKAPIDGVPAGDEKTDADLFIEAVLTAEPKFNGRLTFLKMPKPAPTDRPESLTWITDLMKRISETLASEELQSLGALWQWESAVRLSGQGVCGDMVSLAQGVEAGELPAKLTAALQLLVYASGGKSVSADTAPGHLTTALTQVLSDHLEHSAASDSLNAYSVWLAGKPPGGLAKRLGPKLNTLLMTSACPTGAGAFVPGLVYRIVDDAEFASAFGGTANGLLDCCFGFDGAEPVKTQKKTLWDQGAKLIAIELSPSCEAAQVKRLKSFLVAGVIVPQTLGDCARSADAWFTVPAFHTRSAADGFERSDAQIVICARYTAALPLDALPGGFKPWFRLRDIPTASLRNQYAAWSSRLGLTASRTA